MLIPGARRMCLPTALTSIAIAIPISYMSDLFHVAASDTVAGNLEFFLKPLECIATPRGPSVIFNEGIFNLLIGLVVYNRNLP